jgi:hypothetical protein
VGEILKVLTAILLVLFVGFAQQILQTVHTAGERLVTFPGQRALQVEPHRSSEEEPSQEKDASEPERQS